MITLTLQTIGGLMIAYAALRVHHRVYTEKSIDKKVVNEMRAEQIVGIAGALLLILGYLAAF
ncbi:MAG: hypothetical protein COV07_00300 [Candidatus Vogelbacteria bacterium CG10_big_fil_rev_8_21_14_0_10_45_14]|uniref:Uncharacterized protein n=1 Tax=Candidatus Vogelbacteria bacterium CG10_big_fil_rev_8_21_14_0_10_45_14 TaxID=1975042 RepID=A0A2H0RL19_9BACT|nr:MAG: hypothetical protein COV07_00300 [Candidatus Vogelbacteria bacterium CG10_big_fil_rev_8_21_14_0_10_45_14]